MSFERDRRKVALVGLEAFVILPNKNAAMKHPIMNSIRFKHYELVHSGIRL